MKLVDQFTYLGSNISSTESDVNMRISKTQTANDRLWKSDPSDEIKRVFFQNIALSLLLYGGTTWTLMKCLEKKLDRNYKSMQRAILSISLK